MIVSWPTNSSNVLGRRLSSNKRSSFVLTGVNTADEAEKGKKGAYALGQAVTAIMEASIELGRKQQLMDAPGTIELEKKNGETDYVIPDDFK